MKLRQPSHGTNAPTFLPFLMSCTRTHLRMAEFGCLASMPLRRAESPPHRTAPNRVESSRIEQTRHNRHRRACVRARARSLARLNGAGARAGRSFDFRFRSFGSRHRRHSRVRGSDRWAARAAGGWLFCGFDSGRRRHTCGGMSVAARARLAGSANATAFGADRVGGGGGAGRRRWRRVAAAVARGRWAARCARVSVTRRIARRRQLQGRQGVERRAERPLQGEEGEAAFVSDRPLTH